MPTALDMKADDWHLKADTMLKKSKDNDFSIAFKLGSPQLRFACTWP